MSTSSTHRIPHTEEEGATIVGTLQRVDSGETNGRGIALICHGSLGHKDYLFQKRLAHRLPIDSFRFDFRGNHESTGSWRTGAFGNDVVDIEVVVEYLTKHFGYVVHLIVGHSRGVVSAIRWMCTSKYSKNVRGFVNVSGRYRMEVSHSLPEQAREQLNKEGFYITRAVVARKELVIRTTTEELYEFMTFDPTPVWDQFPKETHVLTVHGMKDRIVPPYDATIYARAFGARSPGTHNLCYNEEADHNFTGMSDFVVDTILEWWSHLQHNQLQTGVWHTGVRGKL
ncbi:ectomycorrhiza-regulated esterase [Panus rudis PR-1116 ss-1]|nr:ectomycorrhiza-regulated esterase [Panus rudis PR-1116 ss-1]